MKIKVAHHIFASRKGYQTQFRSPDVTESENAELESFSFGQTNDTNYMASLKKHPAFTVRKLRSGRWAITRVFQGADDDYGRATLRFHTVLVSQKEWASLDFDVLPLLEHPALWQDTESTEVSVEPDDSPLPQDITEQVLFLLNQLTASSSPVIVDESICSLQIVRWVHRRLLDEDKEEFSYGYRVLSDAMDASLLCLARQALRTATPGAGRYDKVRVSAPSPFKTPDYENMNMAYDKPASSNKVAILIIITVCVLGIAGAIFALVAVNNAQNNAQKEKILSEIIQPANSLLGKNYSFFADPNILEQAVKKAKTILGTIDEVDFPAPQLEPIRKKLKTWINEETQVRKLFDRVEKLEKDLANKRLQAELYSYPTKIKINSVITIEKGFAKILEELVNNSSSLKFFGDAKDELEGNVNISRKNIANWKKEIGKLIAIDPNVAEEIETVLNEADPNQFFWADPNQFVDLAKEKNALLTTLKQDFVKSLRDRSLLVARNSPITEHKEKADRLLKYLKEKQDLTAKFSDTWKDLARKANDIRSIEDTLTSEQKVVPIWLSVLTKYEKKLNTDLKSPEEGWVKNLKPGILNFYADKIEPNLRSYFESTVNNLYNKIEASSLNSEKEVFKSLYDYHKELEEQKNNKSHQQENRRQNRRDR